MNWKYKGLSISKISDLKLADKTPEGFIYLITLDNGLKYIGKKNFYSRRKKHFGKKKLALVTDKRLKTFEIVVKESDWLTYTSSNSVVKALIKEKIPFEKEILEICYSKMELTYMEAKYMFLSEVLENKTYLNDNILGKFYRKNLFKQ